MMQKVTRITPHQMGLLARLLFHLIRGGRFRQDTDPLHTTPPGRNNSHYKMVIDMVPMLSNINMFRYSNACVVYQVLAIEALHPILHSRGLYMLTCDRTTDNVLILPTKPKHIATLFSCAWEDVECAIDKADAINVLLECAETEMSAKASKSSKNSKISKTFPFVNGLLNGIVGGSTVQVLRIWNHPGVMRALFRCLLLPETPRDTVSKLLLAMQVVSCLEEVGMETEHVRPSLSCVETATEDCKAVEILQRKLRAEAIDPLCNFLKLTINRKSSANCLFFERTLEAIACIYQPYSHQSPPLYHKITRIENTIQDCVFALEIIVGTFVSMMATSTRTPAQRVNPLLIKGVTVLGSTHFPHFTDNIATTNPVPQSHPQPHHQQKWQQMKSTLMPISSDSLFALYHRMIPTLSDGFLAGLPADVIDSKRDQEWKPDTMYAVACMRCFVVIWKAAEKHSEEANQRFLAFCEVNHVARKIIAIMLTTNVQVLILKQNILKSLKIRHYTINKVTDVFYVADLDATNELHGQVERYTRSGMVPGLMTGSVRKYVNGAHQHYVSGDGIKLKLQ